jgi:hypothetical protein
MDISNLLKKSWTQAGIYHHEYGQDDARCDFFIVSTKRRYVPHIRYRGVEKELIKIEYATKRWVVVQRTNSWHNRFRKLLIRYEKKSENYVALVCLACCIIVYRRIILG